MTIVKLPIIKFNYKFKNKKQARQEAIKALMNCINDTEILNEIEVKTKKGKLNGRKTK